MLSYTKPNKKTSIIVRSGHLRGQSVGPSLSVQHLERHSLRYYITSLWKYDGVPSCL